MNWDVNELLWHFLPFWVWIAVITNIVPVLLMRRITAKSLLMMDSLLSIVTLTWAINTLLACLIIFNAVENLTTHQEGRLSEDGVAMNTLGYAYLIPVLGVMATLAIVGHIDVMPVKKQSNNKTLPLDRVGITLLIFGMLFIAVSLQLLLTVPLHIDVAGDSVREKWIATRAFAPTIRWLLYIGSGMSAASIVVSFLVVKDQYQAD